MTDQGTLRSEASGNSSLPANDIWRKEIHARVAGFRTRRGRRIEGAFSMRFPFPSVRARRTEPGNQRARGLHTRNSWLSTGSAGAAPTPAAEIAGPEVCDPRAGTSPCGSRAIANGTRDYLPRQTQRFQSCWLTLNRSRLLCRAPGPSAKLSPFRDKQPALPVHSIVWPIQFCRNNRASLTCPKNWKRIPRRPSSMACNSDPHSTRRRDPCGHIELPFSACR